MAAVWAVTAGADGPPDLTYQSATGRDGLPYEV